MLSLIVMPQVLGVPGVLDFLSIKVLQSVGSWSDDFDNFVGSLPIWTQDSWTWVFGVLENTSENEAPELKISNIDPCIVIAGSLLLVVGNS